MKPFLRLLLLLIPTCILAQPPRTISYQGIAVNSISGVPLPNGTHSMTLRLYDVQTGGTPLWSETQSASTTSGIFSVILGSVNPFGALPFDQPYFLGVSVDGGGELSPRTALTAVPYAMNGGVSSINGGSGALTLVGSGGTTVSRSGGAITIASSGGSGGGVQGVQSSDGVIGVLNPTGPMVGLSINPNSITGGEIADGTITSADIAPGAISTRLKLPYLDSVISTPPMFELLQRGEGDGVSVFMENDSSLGIGIFSVSHGRGSAGFFANDGPVFPTPNPALLVTSQHGDGIRIEQSGRGNTAVALSVTTSSAGSGITVTQTDTGSSLHNPAIDIITSAGSTVCGRFGSLKSNLPTIYAYTFAAGGTAGRFEIINTNNAQPALACSTNGSGHALSCSGTAFKTAGGNTWATPSDIRLKRDIHPFTDGLDLLLQIRPVRFHYNGQFGTRTDLEEIGVIAQEMEKIAPYTVERRMMREHPDSLNMSEQEVLTYNSGALTYVTVNAVRELNGRVEQLRAELRQRDARIDELERRFAELEAIVRGTAP